MVAYHPEQSDLETGNIFYIDYIATAPLNRKMPSLTPVYTGIGKALIESACKHYNNSLQYKLGFSLHSLPDAESFYKSLGMDEVGKDPKKQNLVKFEMRMQSCSNFLSTRTAV